MKDEIYFKEASSLLSEYTQIEKPWDGVKNELNLRVLHLLENDLPALYQLLYRIDIDEHKARLAFGGDSKTIAQNLTELIMHRILQKAKTRHQFKAGKTVF